MPNMLDKNRDKVIYSDPKKKKKTKYPNPLPMNNK